MKNNNLSLWLLWFDAFLKLRAACSRTRTFLWLILTAAAMTTRVDLAGVTSLVRCHWLKEKCYPRLLHLFHSSALNLQRLTRCWVGLCFQLFERHLYRIGDRVVLLADGIKVPKEGKKMPAVKLLHQESDCNAKAPFIMGHSCQTISLLVHATHGFFSVPLVSRIHEGLVFSNRCCQSLLDKLVKMLLALELPQPFYLVADGYYASRKVARPLLEKNQHLIARLRTNAVGYRPAPAPDKPTRGRPKIYGSKLRLRECFKHCQMISAPSPVYNEKAIEIRYCTLQLLWRPLGRVVQFVLVEHPKRGRIILLCTDLELDPLVVIQLYGLRFKIEVSFRQAIYTVGTYAYHFWMRDMTPIKRGGGNQYLHRKCQNYRLAVRRKIAAYHRHIQLGLIVQGLLQYLAVCFPKLVWKDFGSWLRTMNPQREPSEMVVAMALRNRLPDFLANTPEEHFFKKFLLDKFDPDRCPELLLDDFRLAA